MVIDYDAELWIWDARKLDSWTFVTVPADASAEIRDRAGGLTRGFGSLRVRVTVGGSTWATSIFPDGKSGTYVLPVKKAVRRAESLGTGDVASVSLEVVGL